MLEMLHDDFSFFLNIVILDFEYWGAVSIRCYLQNRNVHEKVYSCRQSSEKIRKTSDAVIMKQVEAAIQSVYVQSVCLHI